MQLDVEKEKASCCIDREDDKQFLFFFFWKYLLMFLWYSYNKSYFKIKAHLLWES